MLCHHFNTATKKRRKTFANKLENLQQFFLHTSPYHAIRHNSTHIIHGKALFRFNIFVIKERNEQATVCYKLKFRLLILIVLNCCVKLRNEAVISKIKFVKKATKFNNPPRYIHKMCTKFMYYQSVMERDCNNTKETLNSHRLFSKFLFTWIQTFKYTIIDYTLITTLLLMSTHLTLLHWTLKYTREFF